MSTTTTGTTDAGATPTASPTSSESGRRGLRLVEPSLLDRAKDGDRRAIDTMFAQFLPPGEVVRESDHLGVLGMWGFGTHSFAAVTDRRVASLRVGVLGAVTYQDGGLEHVNSGVVVQPSRWLLFVGAAAWLLLAALVGVGLPLALAAGAAVTTLSALLVVGGAVLLLPLLVAVHHRFRKCGLVLWVREGVSVYAFADRRLLRRANHLYRTAQALRERRLAAVGTEPGAGRGAGDAEEVGVPSQRPGEPTPGGRPRRGARGIAIVAAGALLVVAGLALPVATASWGDDGEGEQVVPVPTEAPFTYGDDAGLDALVDDCRDGDGAACDSLFVESPSGSEYEVFGSTCGGRLPEGTDCASVDLE
jgi:hypothetical protein